MNGLAEAQKILAEAVGTSTVVVKTSGCGSIKQIVITQN